MRRDIKTILHLASPLFSFITAWWVKKHSSVISSPEVAISTFPSLCRVACDRDTHAVRQHYFPVYATICETASQQCGDCLVEWCFPYEGQKQLSVDPLGSKRRESPEGVLCLWYSWTFPVYPWSRGFVSPKNDGKRHPKGRISDLGWRSWP